MEEQSTCDKPKATSCTTKLCISGWAGPRHTTKPCQKNKQTKQKQMFKSLSHLVPYMSV